MAFCTDCDYCGHISLCEEDGAGGKGCSSCLQDINEPKVTTEEAVASMPGIEVALRPCQCGSGVWWQECPAADGCCG